MKQKTKIIMLKVKFLLMIILLDLLLFGMFVYYHESTHKTIYDSYGINSTYGLSWTSAYVFTNEYNKCDDYCRLSQNMVEVVGYHLISFYALFIIIINVLILMIAKYKIYKFEEQYKIDDKQEENQERDSGQNK